MTLVTPPSAHAQAGVGYVDVVRSAAFFADGSVRDGFDEFLSIVNTSDQVGDIVVRFTARNDTADNVLVPSLRLTLEGHEQVTQSLRDHLSDQRVRLPVTFSLRIYSERPIAAELIRYFRTSYAGGVSGSTTVVGAPEPELVHLFADGGVGPERQDLLTIYYPILDDKRTKEKDASIDIFFGVERRGEVKHHMVVKQGDRTTIDVNRLLADNGVHDSARVSTRLVSSEGVVVQRSSYMRSPIEGGTAILGTDIATPRWFFATTMPDADQESIVVFNPGGGASKVTATFRGASVSALSGDVPPRGQVALEVPRGGGPASVDVVATGNVVVERTVGTPTNLSTVRAARFLAHQQTIPHGRAGEGVDHRISIGTAEGRRGQARLRFDARGEGDTVVAVPDLVVDVTGDAPTVVDVNAWMARNNVSQPVTVATEIKATEPIVAERYLRAAGPSGPAALVTGAFALEEPEPVGLARLFVGVALMAAMVVAAVVALLRALRPRSEESVAPPTAEAA